MLREWNIHVHQYEQWRSISNQDEKIKLLPLFDLTDFVDLDSESEPAPPPGYNNNAGAGDDGIGVNNDDVMIGIDELFDPDHHNHDHDER
jgi:hypothetical protein